MKPSSLFEKSFFPDTDTLKRTALYSLLLLFAAHAFCFFNLTYSSGSVMLNVSSGRSAQIEAGHYLLPLYWRIRGSISSPFFVGMLSMLYLTLTNLVLVALLGIRQPLHLFALCGVTTVNAAVLSICAASLHTADAAFLALLLSALSCLFCLRMRLGVLPGALLLVGALALDSGACAFFAALALITLLADLLDDRSARLFALAAPLAALAAALLLHQLGHMLMLRRSGMGESAGLLFFGGDLFAAYLAPVRALFSPLTAYAWLSRIIRILLAVLCAAGLIPLARRQTKKAWLLAAGLLALPLLCGFTILPAQASQQITPAHCLLDVCLVMLLSRLTPDRKAIRRLMAAAFSALFLGSIVFANQVYLKKNLEFESTLSVMSRVITRMEKTPGYQPGYTPVAIAGTPEDSVFSVERKGFEHLSALDAAKGNFAIADKMDMIWYMWEVMGYPVNFVSTHELALLTESDAVRSMPVFPQDGCCAFVDGVLVVKLSP